MIKFWMTCLLVLGPNSAGENGDDWAYQFHGASMVAICNQRSFHRASGKPSTSINRYIHTGWHECQITIHMTLIWFATDVSKTTEKWLTVCAYILFATLECIGVTCGSCSNQFTLGMFPCLLFWKGITFRIMACAITKWPHMNTHVNCASFLKGYFIIVTRSFIPELFQLSVCHLFRHNEVCCSLKYSDIH